MSSTSSLDRLRNATGTAIQSVHVELWSGASDAERATISIGIRLDGGSAFILSCAGDGSIHIANGELGTSKDNIDIRNIDEFTGARLESVNFEGDRIVLGTAIYHLSIVNDCDELEVEINNEPLEAYLRK